MVGSEVGPQDPDIVVVMGVSGSGKTTVAKGLSTVLGWEFAEGDAFHPEANVAKMRSGTPLTDEDRWPWLELVAEWIQSRLDAGQSGIITCSALKRSYRDRLNRRGSGVTFVYLAGDKETIAARLSVRQGHFFPTTLLDSQFADLEEPTADEPSLRVDVGPDPSATANRIINELGLVPREVGEA